MRATAPRWNTSSGSADGLHLAALDELDVLRRRSTPCESWPATLASTSDRATASACSGEVPVAARIAVATAMSSAGVRRSSVGHEISLPENS